MTVVNVWSKLLITLSGWLLWKSRSIFQKGKQKQDLLYSHNGSNTSICQIKVRNISVCEGFIILSAAEKLRDSMYVLFSEERQQRRGCGQVGLWQAWWGVFRPPRQAPLRCGKVNIGHFLWKYILAKVTSLLRLSAHFVCITEFLVELLFQIRNQFYKG